MATTLSDVAKVAGVHITTASSILNESSGNTRFSDSTRARVEKVAKRLGYTTNHIARSLRTRRTKTIGLVAGIIQNPFFAALALHLEHHLSQHGYELVLTCHGTNAKHNESDLALLLAGRSVDGLLIWWSGHYGRPKLPSHFETPRVWMGYGLPSEASVRLNLAGGLLLAAEYLHTLGCSRIGYYGPLNAATVCLPKSRLKMFEEACAAHHLSDPIPLLFDGQDWDLSQASASAAPFIDQARNYGLDAVVGYNDISAVGWQLASRAAGFDIPLVSFDGSPLIKSWRPAIPFVDLNIESLAKMSVDLIISLIKGDRSKRLLRVHPTFEAGDGIA